MRTSRTSLILVFFVAAIIAGVGWLYFHRYDSSPFSIPQSALSGWTLVTTDGTDPWVVAARPPDTLTTALFAEASRRAGRALVAPKHHGLPLVLRGEFEEGLQGVYGADSVMRIAHETGVDSAQFEPICLARHRATDNSSADLYFVAFESPVFTQMRVDLVPPLPEQAGVGIYDPTALTPVLVVGATDDKFERWWPLHFDATRDCLASLTPPAAQR